MATVVRHDLLGCDGFRVEASQGLVGWIEEPWLGAAEEPAALALRTVEGKRGLLMAEDVEMVLVERELVVMRTGGRLLELDVPRALTISADGSFVVSASWRTTGETLEPPKPPGMLQRALLGLRPWRLAPPREPGAERPVWQLVAILYTVLAGLVALLIALTFLAAWVAAGRAY
jgi:hypothetical protein